jgi:hypothetical protein
MKNSTTPGAQTLETSFSFSNLLIDPEEARASVGPFRDSSAVVRKAFIGTSGTSRIDSESDAGWGFRRAKKEAISNG